MSTDRKAQLRRQAYDARRKQADKDAVSQRILQRVIELPEYHAAKTALWYVDCRSEVRTRAALPRVLAGSQTIVVPYCTRDARGVRVLGLWHLTSLDELELGEWSILAPPEDRWHDPARQIAPSQLDVVLVPGVAFDRTGMRLGNGQGYYDRLLSETRPDCWRIGIGYDCQIMDQIPADAHDVRMHRVVTENQVIAP